MEYELEDLIKNAKSIGANISNCRGYDEKDCIKKAINKRKAEREQELSYKLSDTKLIEDEEEEKDKSRRRQNRR